MESMQNNTTELNTAGEANADDQAPNLTAKEAAEIIIAAHTPSMVEDIANAIPFRLAPESCADGHFSITFLPEGGMNVDVDNLAVQSRIEELEPNRTDFMILMGVFLIQQAEAALRGTQVKHLTEQLEELVNSGAVKLGPTVSPELAQMLASIQQAATVTTDQLIAEHSPKQSSTGAAAE